MIYLKTLEEIELMQQAGILLSRTLGEIAKWVAPGVTTHKLDAVAREFIHDNGGRPHASATKVFRELSAWRSMKW